MKKWMVVLSVLLLAMVCSAAFADVEISEENFPDENFRNYVMAEFDITQDGVLDDEEIGRVENITVEGNGISSLKGVEYFTNLKELNAKTNCLGEIDISRNTKLVTLDVTNNVLSQLDVSKNTALEDLWCTNNAIIKLDLSKNRKLEKLGCATNDLSELDISANKKLKELYCDFNQFTTVDVSKSETLTKLVKNKKRMNSGNGYDYWEGKGTFLYVGSKVTVKAGTVISNPTTEAPTVTVDGMVFQIGKNEATLREIENKDLKKLTIPDTVKYNKKNYKVRTINHFACEKMTKLTTVKIGKYVNNIGNAAFAQCTKLKSVTGGEYVQNIGVGAFEGCTSLATFTLGEKVKKIERRAFYDCAGLKTLIVKTEKLTSSTVGDKAFGGKTNIRTVKCPKAKKTAYKKAFSKKGIDDAKYVNLK